jgi:very-short-patch-repair endonuclease
MSRLVENFDPGTTRFDVVIIDEASQADAMGLIPLYMAKSVVIVGDNEQVSPDAVGDRLDTTQRLIDEHLSGIPNAILYDGQRSMYDIALESFGGHICLTEHFRCASEIIAFSNKLSYGGRIKPLRDMSASKLRPHVVPYRVQGGLSNKKVNEREAETVAALLCAAIEQPEYAGATFGVISLLGEEQARRIETLLRQWLSPAEYEERRIMCGMPPQFQGDERDVMFLSVVDGPVGGPLTLRADGANAMYKKRYNVAASRARDQMWVVYSVQPDVDLQPLDIRRTLISHALDPMAAVKEFQGVEEKAESEFEREVIRRLIDRGYRVTPQWPVGRYRLDIVVDDGEKRLAIECDGDRYHPLEKLADDMARQAILERLGWTFARIRGSAFFRDPEEAMKPVFARLESLGIAPIGLTEPLPASEANHSDLTRRIIARAEERLREMTVGNDDVMPAVVVQEEMVLDLQDSALE